MNFLVQSLQSFVGKIFFACKLVRVWQLPPYVWDTWMILIRKRLLVDFSSIADYQNHSQFGCLRTLILIAACQKFPKISIYLL